MFILSIVYKLNYSQKIKLYYDTCISTIHSKCKIRNDLKHFCYIKHLLLNCVIWTLLIINAILSFQTKMCLKWSHCRALLLYVCHKYAHFTFQAATRTYTYHWVKFLRNLLEDGLFVECVLAVPERYFPPDKSALVTRLQLWQGQQWLCNFIR